MSSHLSHNTHTPCPHDARRIPIINHQHQSSINNTITNNRIFTIAPEAYPLFSFSSSYKMMSEEMYASASFQKHVAGVIRTVNTAVGMLGPDLAPLAEILKKLGKRHKGYGVLEAHYSVVGQALIETLAAALQDAFTDEVKAAWVDVWGVISGAMIEGAAY
jgi:hemoglobin-like flavoprotein